MTDPQNPSEPTPNPDTPPAYNPPAADAPPPADVPPAPPAYGEVPPAAAPAYAQTPPAEAPAYAAAPPAAPPAYGAAPPAPYGAPSSAEVPGKTLGIVALIAVFFVSLIGLILGYVARSQSKKAGVENTPAKIAIILGWIFLVLTVIIIVISIILVIAAGTAFLELCEGLEAGVYELDNGTTITCP